MTFIIIHIYLIVINDKVFVVHGGLSTQEGGMTLTQIENLPRNREPPESGLMSDLLWSDPDATVESWDKNDRGFFLLILKCCIFILKFLFELGVSFVFSASVIRAFLDKHGLELICRAHQVVEDGYEFFAGLLSKSFNLLIN